MAPATLVGGEVAGEEVQVRGEAVGGEAVGLHSYLSSHPSYEPLQFLRQLLTQHCFLQWQNAKKSSANKAVELDP